MQDAQTFAEAIWDIAMCHTFFDEEGNVVNFYQTSEMSVISALQDPLADLVKDGSYFIYFGDSDRFTKYEFRDGRAHVFVGAKKCRGLWEKVTNMVYDS